MPKNAGLSDFERTLTRRGAAECECVAGRIALKKLSVDLMISSPADRALETAHVFARHLKYPCEKIQIMDTLYSSDSVLPILAQIKRLPDSVRAVAVFGHNPSFDKMAAYFMTGYLESIPKGGVVAITLNAEPWGKMKKGIGTLQYSIAPSARDQETTAPRGSTKQAGEAK